MTTDQDLTAPDGWTIEGDSLHRELTFGDFAAAFAFMTRVAELAEEADHHPDWSNSWNRVVIDLTSHDVGRITSRDLRLAERISGVIEG